MADINIENIFDLDLSGHDLFQDSESFITELDGEGEFIVGGFDFGGQFCLISDIVCDVTVCLITIGLCGNTATCFNTIGSD